MAYIKATKPDSDGEKVLLRDLGKKYHFTLSEKNPQLSPFFIWMEEGKAQLR